MMCQCTAVGEWGLFVMDGRLLPVKTTNITIDRLQMSAKGNSSGKKIASVKIFSKWALFFII